MHCEITTDKKKTEMKHITTFGDSIMGGIVLDPKSATCSPRYTLLENSFSARCASALGIEIKNHGRFGSTTRHGLREVERWREQVVQSDFVVMEFGGNDCDFRWADVSADPDGQFEPNTPESQFLSTYRDMISYAREKGATPVIASLVPIDADRYMNWITRNLSYQNILHWLGDVAMLSRWQEYYSRMAERLAYETGCPLLDLRGAFLQTRSYKNLIGEDGIHPTKMGHELIDRTLTEFCTV